MASGIHARLGRAEMGGGGGGGGERFDCLGRGDEGWLRMALLEIHRFTCPDPGPPRAASFPMPASDQVSKPVLKCVRSSEHLSCKIQSKPSVFRDD
jgi:hypothetical protein